MWGSAKKRDERKKDEYRKDHKKTDREENDRKGTDGKIIVKEYHCFGIISLPAALHCKQAPAVIMTRSAHKAGRYVHTGFEAQSRRLDGRVASGL